MLASCGGCLCFHVGLAAAGRIEKARADYRKADCKTFQTASLPSYLISYIESFCPAGDASIAVHSPRSVKGYTERKGEMDKATITRSKGFIGDREMEVGKFPDAVHHVNVLYNEAGKARVFYRYRGSVRFLKTGQKHDEGV